MLSNRVPLCRVESDPFAPKASGASTAASARLSKTIEAKRDPVVLAQQAAATFSIYQESEDKRDLCRAADHALQAIGRTIEESPSSWQSFQHLTIILSRWSVYHPAVESLAIALREWSMHQRDWSCVQERYTEIEKFCERACEFVSSATTSPEHAPAIAHYQVLTNALEKVQCDIVTADSCRHIFNRLWRKLRGQDIPKIGAVQLESERALLSKRKDWLSAFGRLLHEVNERRVKQQAGSYPSERPLASYEEILSWKALWSDLHRSYAPDGPLFRKASWEQAWRRFRDSWLPLEHHISDDAEVKPLAPLHSHTNTSASRASLGIDSLLALAETTYQRAHHKFTTGVTSNGFDNVLGLPERISRPLVELVLTDATGLRLTRDENIGLVAHTLSGHYTVQDGRMTPLHPSVVGLFTEQLREANQPTLCTFEECVGLQRLVLEECRDSHLADQSYKDSPHGTIILHLDDLAGADQLTRTRIQIMAETVAQFDPATAVVLTGSEDLVRRFEATYDSIPPKFQIKPPVFTDPMGVPNLDRAVHIKSTDSSPDETCASNMRAIHFDAIKVEPQGSFPSIPLVAPRFFAAQTLSRRANAQPIDESR